MAKTPKTNKASYIGQNTGEIVLSAIKKLMKNTGWTARTIVKFIKMEYSMNDPTLSRKVSRALKRGVRLGVLQADRGRYRLSDISTLAKPAVSGQILHNWPHSINNRGLFLVRTKHAPLRIRSRSNVRENNRRRKIHG